MAESKGKYKMDEKKSTVEKLHRSRENQVLAGVCGGIAETYGIDFTLVRVIFVILAIWGGLGILLYILGILFLPYPGEKSVVQSGQVEKKIEEVAEDIKNNISDKNKGKTANQRRSNEIIGLIVVLLGAIMLLRNFYPWIGMHMFWPILLILIGILIISGSKKESK